MSVRTIRMSRPFVALAVGAAVLFASGMFTILVAMAIWPGEATLTAPLLCDDARPDPFVVRDTYNVRPGETSMTFSLHCVGPRGDYDEVGWTAPMLVLWAAHTAILLVLVGLVVARGRIRRSRRAVNEPLLAPPPP